MAEIDKKREEIRKGISVLMDTCWEKCNPDYPKLLTFRPMKFLNELMPYLHSQGVVIKVKGELPRCMNFERYNALTKAGYVTVEPLIGDKSADILV